MANSNDPAPGSNGDSASESVKRSVSRTQDFKVWVGTQEDLIRLESSVRRALELIKGQLDFDGMKSYDRDYTLKALECQTTIHEEGDQIKRTGGMAAVLAEVDVREVSSVVIRNKESSFVDFSILVRLGGDRRWSDEAENRVEVRGAEPQWVAGTFDTLVREVRKGGRPWAFLRGAAGRVVALVFGLPCLAWILTQDASASSKFSVSLWLGVLVLLAAMYLGPIWNRRLFPSFQLLAPGGATTSARFGSAVLTVLAVVGFGLTVLQFVV